MAAECVTASAKRTSNADGVFRGLLSARTNEPRRVEVAVCGLVSPAAWMVAETIYERRGRCSRPRADLSRRAGPVAALRRLRQQRTRERARQKQRPQHGRTELAPRQRTHVRMPRPRSLVLAVTKDAQRSDGSGSATESASGREQRPLRATPFLQTHQQPPTQTHTATSTATWSVVAPDSNRGTPSPRGGLDVRFRRRHYTQRHPPTFSVTATILTPTRTRATADSNVQPKSPTIDARPPTLTTTIPPCYRSRAYVITPRPKAASASARAHDGSSRGAAKPPPSATASDGARALLTCSDDASSSARSQQTGSESFRPAAGGRQPLATPSNLALAGEPAPAIGSQCAGPVSARSTAAGAIHRKHLL